MAGPVLVSDIGTSNLCLLYRPGRDLRPPYIDYFTSLPDWGSGGNILTSTIKLVSLNKHLNLYPYKADPSSPPLPTPSTIKSVNLYLCPVIMLRLTFDPQFSSPLDQNQPPTGRYFSSL